MMRRLELEFRIENMLVLYEEKAVWHNSKFTCNKDFTAHLKLWEDGIEPEQITEAWKQLEELGGSCRVAMKYGGNHSVVFKKNDSATYYFDEQVITPPARRRGTLCGLFAWEEGIL